ncbi:hypothetical protein [Streptomyces sp. SID12501]|uniref:Uncharacterized protein n=1 Tax=Streptomyces sp. SID12501 TaxID=2706042 RepID=A0A6B3C4D5_9ACTN|nr:hypothetical protein [Streptomyces sp. SID12501]NEC91583.1 hypothetical protein [Streptomyces sp. SID12501]
MFTQAARLTYDEGGGRVANTGTIKPLGVATAKAARLAKLLSVGIGEIREVRMNKLL